MKICIVNPRAVALYDPSSTVFFGGAEVESYMLSLLLAEMGHEVHVILRDQPQELYSECRSIRFHTLGQKQKLPLYIQLWRTLSEANADVVLMKLVHELSAATAQWCRMHRRGFLFRSANKRDAELASGVHSHGKRQSFLFRLTCHKRTLIVAQTPEQLASYQQRFGSNQVRQILNYNHEEETNSLPFSERQGILWVGHLMPVKRPELVLELARRLPHIPFTVIASTASWIEVKEQEAALSAQTNIRYLKNLPLREMAPFFREARIHLNTSRSEGFPNTFLQAIASGLPLATTGIDPGGLIKQHNLGYASEDLDHLQDWLDRTCCNPKHWEPVSAIVQRYQQNVFSRARYKEFYQKALDDALELAKS